MNNTQPVYNQQADNNQDNCHENVQSSRIFNNSIHGYIEHISGKGPVVAYSEVTYLERGQDEPSLFSKVTTAVPGRIVSSFPESSTSSTAKCSEDGRGEEATPDPSVIEAEFHRVSPEMQEFITYLLCQYEKSVTRARKGGQAGEGD